MVFTGLILNMFTILICILIYRCIAMEGLIRNILIIAILSIGLLFVNLVIVKDGLRNEYEEKMLATYEKYLPKHSQRFLFRDFQQKMLIIVAMDCLI